MDRIRELNRHSREVFRQIREGVPPRPRPGILGAQQELRHRGTFRVRNRSGPYIPKIGFSPTRRNDRQQDVPGSGGLGEDAVAGDARLLPLAFRLARIWVDVEMWEVAASYVETRAVPAAEQIGDREQLDGDRIDLIQHHPPKPAARSAPASRVGCCIHRQRIWP